MFHYCNWQLWDRWEDYYAWKSLSGEIGKEEIVAEARAKGREKGSPLGVGRIKWLFHNDDNYRKKQLQHNEIIQPLAVEAAKSEKARQKRKETFQVNKHQQGSRNSQYGTMWVTNGETNKKIGKENSIPKGYWKGRTL